MSTNLNLCFKCKGGGCSIAVICSSSKPSLIIYKYLCLFICSIICSFYVMPIRISHAGLIHLSQILMGCATHRQLLSLQLLQRKHSLGCEAWRVCCLLSCKAFLVGHFRELTSGDMTSAVKNYGFPNTERELSGSEVQNLNYHIMRNHAQSCRECGSASILRGEVAITEIRISFLAFVLKKK